MKFLKLSAALFVVANALLLFSCKKNDNPNPGDGNIPQDTIPHDTIPGDTTVPLLTKVLFYSNMSENGDAILYNDSIYYNDKQQISQVVTFGPSGGSTYSFVYNNEGLLTSLATHRVADHFFVKYELLYKNNRLDEIIYRDTIGAPTEIFAKLSYNDQGKLLNLTSYANDMGQMDLLYKTNYIRNATGIVDSVNILSGAFVSQGVHPSGTVTPVNQIWQRVDKAYLFMLAARVQYMLFPPGANNLFLHQFLNADDNFFNDGIINTYSGASVKKYEQYNTALDLNADSTMKTYHYYQGPQGGATKETINAQFFYIRK